MRILVVAFVATLTLSTAGMATETPIQLLPVDVEVEMALSAAPEPLREAAGVHILTASGYVRKRESRNGFECLVEREGKQGTAPICFDSEGARTTLQAVIMRTSLLQSGIEPSVVRDRIKQAYAAGQLKAPGRPGIAYMLSTHFKSYDPKKQQLECVFPPHVMFYAPYLKNADFGIPRSDFGSTMRPWILNEGEPDAYFIVADHSQAHTC